MPSTPIIRQYRPEDEQQVEDCIVELQDFCKQIDPLAADGRTVARKYLQHLLEQCEKTDGRIFVAEQDDKVIGMLCVIGKVSATLMDEEDYNYANVSDLVILAAERKKGLGRALLSVAEEHARSQGAQYLRIGVHAPNKVARDLYNRQGFRERIVILHKDLRT
jgi:ribosomal protein S18 acetylase RimI-like enzyme